MSAAEAGEKVGSLKASTAGVPADAVLRLEIHKVYLRRHCNKLLRHAVHLWANLSRQSCPWAAVYYEQLRTRGKNHACALRSLGQRWLKILWKMWQTGTRYDAELHARNQLKHGSWVLKIQNA